MDRTTRAHITRKVANINQRFSTKLEVYRMNGYYTMYLNGGQHVVSARIAGIMYAHLTAFEVGMETAQRQLSCADLIEACNYEERLEAKDGNIKE